MELFQPRCIAKALKCHTIKVPTSERVASLGSTDRKKYFYGTKVPHINGEKSRKKVEQYSIFAVLHLSLPCTSTYNEDLKTKLEVRIMFLSVDEDHNLPPRQTRLGAEYFVHML